MFFPERSTQFTGADLAAMLRPLQGFARENFILEQVRNGCVPDFMRHSAFLALDAPGGVKALLEVAPDYLCLGTDDDYVYAQCSIVTAQKIADVIDGMLPTRRMVDEIWKQAVIKIKPEPWGPPYDASMSSSERLLAHGAKVRAAKAVTVYDPIMLCAGGFKDYILVSALAQRPDRTCIYGWHQPNGVPIQGVNPSAHERDYVDYSQCPRFVSRVITIGDDTLPVADVLADPLLNIVVSGSGPSQVHRVPGV